jgi:TonB-linked SusC/RagA family outer membrane protein
MAFKALFIIPPRKGITKTLRIMRLTAILLLAACLQVSARGFSQTVTLSMKNASLEQVFNQVKQQTGLSFIWDEQMLKQTRAVDIDVKNAPITEVMDWCMKGQPLTYQIIGKIIVIKLAPTVDLQSAVAPPPPIDIHGHVTDSLGKPLEGASVTVKGSKKGTSTDANGLFDLKGIDNNVTLVISFTGYETREIKLNGRSEITLQLKPGVTSMQDVVVNKGYYSTTNRLNTGDVTSVKGEDIQRQPVTDPILALEGAVPGLYVSQASGIPGAPLTVRLRGQNSIANGNAPFYIVDGVPFTSVSLTSSAYGGGAITVMSPFNSLSPADIESIEVLKDADATAIYGSRGANGVILITTKKGQAGKTNIDINASSGWGKIDRRADLLRTQQYLAMRHEAFANDGATPGSSNTDYDLLAWDTTRYTDWQKALIGGTANLTNINGSLSGGNDNTRFMFGGGYVRQTTVFPATFSDQKSNIHFNITHTSPDKKFKAVFSGMYLVDNSNLPTADLTRNINLAPDAPPLYNADETLNWALVNGTASWTNPVAILRQTENSTTDNLIGNLDLSYLVLPGLTIKSSFGYTNIGMNQTIIIPLSSYNPAYSIYPSIRTNNYATNVLKTWIVEPQIVYNRRFGGGVLDGQVGITFQDNTQNAISQYAYGFSDDALIPNIAAASNWGVASVSATDYRYNALFAHVGYTLKDEYLLNFTARRDGSSRFGPGNQFGNFGAVGIGWIFSKERAVQRGLPFLNFGKVRASYGTTGNDQISNYQYLSSYSSYAYPYQGLSGLYPTRIANPNYGWERVNKLEIGLELGMAGNRVTTNIDYYINRSNDQLVGYTLPQITGFTSVQANLPAIVQNNGFEAFVSTKNIVTGHFSWTTSANISFPRNKLVSYPNIDNSSYANVYTVGKSLFTQKLFHYTGVDPTTGIYTFATKSGNGVPVYPDDLQSDKQIAQTFFGGFRNTFTYGGLQLDIFFQFVKQTAYTYLEYFGGPAGQFGGSYGADGNQPTAVLSRWQKPADMTNVEQFTQNFGSNAANAYFTSISQGDNAIGDASFIRLKNVVLSYQIHAHSLQKNGIENCRVYIQGQNLLTITKYVGLDPEVANSALPPIRMIVGGIQLTF